MNEDLDNVRKTLDELVSQDKAMLAQMMELATTVDMHDKRLAEHGRRFSDILATIKEQAEDIVLFKQFMRGVNDRMESFWANVQLATANMQVLYTNFSNVAKRVEWGHAAIIGLLLVLILLVSAYSITHW